MTMTLDQRARFFEKFKDRDRPGHLHKPIGFSRDKLLGDIGIEIELESLTPLPSRVAYSSPTTSAAWIAIHDGSLRGDHSREFIVSAPVLLDELEPGLNYLFTAIRDFGSTIQLTNRCSTHVHLNVQNKKVNTVSSFMTLYGIYEQVLLAWCGEERKNNSFCLSFANCSDTLEAWVDFIKTSKHPTDSALKYSSFNILPVFTKGSVEIRSGKASDNPIDPYNWARLLHYMLKYCERNFKTPLDVIEKINAGQSYESFLREVSPASSGFIDEIVACNRRGTFEETCEKGLKPLYSLIHEIRWKYLEPTFDRVYVNNPFAS
jgi:Putative amidoligase enzyme